MSKKTVAESDRRQERIPFFQSHSLYCGLSISLIFSALVMVLRYSGANVLERVPGYILVPLALSALLFVQIINRFFTRNITFVLRLLTMPLIFAAAVLMPRLMSTPPVSLAVLFIIFSSIFLLVLPCFRGSMRSCIQTFCLTLMLSTVLVFLMELLLDESSDSMKPAAMIALLLALAAVLFFTYRADAPRQAEESDRLLPEPAGRFVYGLFSFTSWLACLTTAIMITQLTRRSIGGMSVAYVTGVVLFLLMIGIHMHLIRISRLWQMAYAVFTAFLIGSLLLLAQSGGLLFTYLSMMLLISSAAGMLILSFIFMLHLTSVYNRSLLLGLCYVMIFSVLSLFYLPDQGQWLAELVTAGTVSVLLVAFVLLITPLFLRSFDRLPAPREREEPSPDNEAAAEPESREDRIFDSDSFAQSLTNAERKVYELVLRGYSNQQIADELYVSINTIKFHIKNILGKAGLERKSQLVTYYLQQQQEAAKQAAE